MTPENLPEKVLSANPPEVDSQSLPVPASNIQLQREAPEQVTTKATIEDEKDLVLRLRKHAFYIILPSYLLVLCLTLSVILIEGWHWRGFDLPDAFLHWLGGAVIGEIAGFVYIILKFLFPSASGQGNSNNTSE